MRIRRAIFDKRFSEKGTIMALYDTKNLFPIPSFLVKMYKWRGEKTFGNIYQRKKADTHSIQSWNISF